MQTKSLQYMHSSYMYLKIWPPSKNCKIANSHFRNETYALLAFEHCTIILFKPFINIVLCRLYKMPLIKLLRNTRKPAYIPVNIFFPSRRFRVYIYMMVVAIGHHPVNAISYSCTKLSIILHYVFNSSLRKSLLWETRASTDKFCMYT